jgi:cupin 2 domain-containing protein
MVYLTKGDVRRPPVIETLAETRSIKIDRITARGQVSPPGDFAPEPSNEFILLLKGQLILEYEGDDHKVTLEPGDFAHKGTDQRTRADYTSEEEETVWVKISYRGEPDRYPLFTGAVGPEEVHPKR